METKKQVQEILKMDEVDSAQQIQIDRSERENRQQWFWIKLLTVAILGWLIIVSTIMMVRMTQSYQNDSKNSESVK